VCVCVCVSKGDNVHVFMFVILVHCMNLIPQECTDAQGRSQDFHSGRYSFPLLPSLSFLFPSPPLSLPLLPSIPLSSLPHDPTIPADKRFLVNFENKVKHLTTTILAKFLIN